MTILMFLIPLRKKIRSSHKLKYVTGHALYCRYDVVVTRIEVRIGKQHVKVTSHYFDREMTSYELLIQIS